MDDSGSVDDSERQFAIQFAKDTVSAFASLNLFDNGGTASFAQFAVSASEGSTFTSQEAFDDYVDAAPRLTDYSATNVIGGIAKGRALLDSSSPGNTSFMVVITDGAASADPT
ncbi:unnamed protein product, partial [Hapterophycus canaliculatus]